MKKKSPDFEEQLLRLNVIIEQLEAMDVPLEQSVALYKEGKMLASSCKILLDNARNEVIDCSKEQAFEPLFPVEKEANSEEFTLDKQKGSYE